MTFCLLSPVGSGLGPTNLPVSYMIPLVCRFLVIISIQNWPLFKLEYLFCSGHLLWEKGQNLICADVLGASYGRRSFLEWLDVFIQHLYTVFTYNTPTWVLWPRQSTFTLQFFFTLEKQERGNMETNTYRHRQRHSKKHRVHAERQTNKQKSMHINLWEWLL